MLVSAVFFSLLIIIGFAAEVNSATNSYGYGNIFFYTLLKSGHAFSLILPIIGLFAFLLTVGQLSANSELIALQACGLSHTRMMLLILMSTLATFGTLLIFTELATPWGHNKAETLKANALNQSLIGGKKLWLKNNLHFLYIERLHSPDSMSGVRYYEIDALQKPIKVTSAKTAVRLTQNTWRLNDVDILSFSFDREEDLTLNKVSSSSVDIKNLLEEQRIRFIHLLPEQLFIWELYDQINAFTKNGLSNTHYELNFWSRTLSFLSIVGFVLILLPLFLGSPRHKGTGDRILLGLIIGIPYFIILQLSQYFGIALQWSGFWTAIILPTILLSVGFFRILSLKYNIRI